MVHLQPLRENAINVRSIQIMTYGKAPAPRRMQYVTQELFPRLQSENIDYSWALNDTLSNKKKAVWIIKWGLGIGRILVQF